MGRGKGKGNKKRGPVLGAHVPDKKRPSTSPGAPVSYDKQKPSWRLRSMDTGGPWSWPPCKPNSTEVDIEKTCEIRAKLGDFETMTWAEIKGQRHHRVAFKSLCLKARNRLEEIKCDDADELFSFALQGAERLWAIRSGSVAEILWWDPNHEVYPVKKKHT